MAGSRYRHKAESRFAAADRGQKCADMMIPHASIDDVRERRVGAPLRY
jgi:hypothetical protein